MSFQLEDALIAMLQAIAQAQIQALSKDGHEQLLSAGTVDEDVWHSAQGVYHTRPWRHVTEDDWCGEHSPRVSHQEKQNVTP